MKHLTRLEIAALAVASVTLTLIFILCQTTTP